ncbi:sulfurtransferase [uncultured Cetobacterium sp.]|uniref:sulfurtransferase n=1 Tax=uncultured Cetobacterium sp. TaxID=527638 RepID=UPI002627DD96|nr:rhodanese-like domain-containing protein [uncultured Cetobacterium sp.]
MKKSLILGSLLLSMVAFGKDYTQYKSDKLISPEAAKQLVETNKNVVLIDVRPEAKFMLNNIEGSYNMWRPDMEPKDHRHGEIGGMRASREEMEIELNKMGVTKDTTLVLIGDGLDEYRLWWILDLYGMENIKIVDGGYATLKGTGIKTKFGKEAAEKKGDYKFPETPDKNTLAEMKEMEEACESHSEVILDTRTKKEHTGEDMKKGAVAKGRIPGSVFVEWTEALNKDKTIKSYDELVELYTSKGVTADKEILPYCQSAVRSAHTTFILKELLGYPQVKNYDGSWIEWSHAVKSGKEKVEIGE